MGKDLRVGIDFLNGIQNAIKREALDILYYIKIRNLCLYNTLQENFMKVKKGRPQIRKKIFAIHISQRTFVQSMLKTPTTKLELGKSSNKKMSK